MFIKKIKSDGSLEKLKLRIVFRGYLQNKSFIGDIMRTLKYLLEDAVNKKTGVNQLDFIGSFL